MVDVAPGFRFYPTEEELISFYLHNKLHGNGPPQIDHVIPVVNIYEFSPPDLARAASRGDREQLFFFVPMQEKEARGGRPNRLTDEGYWKATGSPGHVYSSDNSRIIGNKRSMVFYKGRAPNGKRTEWKMNEYSALQLQGSSSSSEPPLPQQLKQELRLCRVYLKSKCVRSFDRRPLLSGTGIVELGAPSAGRQPPGVHVLEHPAQNTASYSLPCEDLAATSNTTTPRNYDDWDIDQILADNNIELSWDNWCAQLNLLD